MSGGQGIPLRDRFGLKIWPRGDCWEWHGSKQRKGYGMFRLGREWVLAHRFAYEEAKGHIPPIRQLDHICHHAWCVRPSHLEVVTCKQNIGRSPRVQRKVLRERGID